MATLTITDVKKNFGDTEVIHGVSLAVDDGEFIVIVGPSGCGKSTLLRMVAGLESVSSGVININDKRVNDLEPMDRNIAMVFQNYALYPHMTVHQNMAYSLKIQKQSRNQINSKVDEAAKLLQLEPYLNRKPKQLSGGQRQRVAMGRAIVREPDIFLFDEPLSNLDAKLRVQMRLEIRNLQTKLGVTSLYVTHDQVEAMTMADRMVVMNGGVAEQIGTPMEVYQRPQSVFAAQFIGSPSMNILPGYFKDKRLHLSNGTELSVSGERDGPVSVGIRPEHLHIDSQGEIEFDISYEEPLGATTLLHGSIVDSTSGIVASVPGVHAGTSNEGGRRLRLRAEEVHLFDAQTGARIE